MEPIKAPRGTRDILGKESWKWAYVTETFRGVADDYGYKEVHLPIFEHTELFSRGVGDTTDIVAKEMYTFKDKSGRSITLRPELTASMVRSYIENDMRSGCQPAKLWSVGPMFRYERPQKGRYRQFVQIDIEAIGAQDAFVDVEVIDLSMELYRRLGLGNLKVVLNSVGCPVCRPTYRKALREFLKPRYDELCNSCRNRYERNPMRILDCKSQICHEISENAPSVTDYLCDECSLHFEKLKRGLDKIGAEVILDKCLVRGLDYYTKTAYEILSGDLGAQNAVCGGGRYDNLSEAIGGPHIPGIGFASGVERVVLSMEAQGCAFGKEPSSKVYIVATDAAAKLESLSLLRALRMHRISADMDYMDRGMKSQMKSAGSLAEYACILGSEEIARGVVAVKDLRAGTQEDFTVEQLINRLSGH